MYNAKALIQSRTFWLAVAQFAVGVIALFDASFGAYVPASVLGVIAMLKSLADVYLRLETTQPIQGITPQQ